MHNALWIYEILECIVNHLAQDLSVGVDIDQQQALAALARTCRAFSEPALDALWRRLDSLKPFILCLPDKASYDNDRMPAFDDKEWSVVLRYAPRVQVLALDDEISLKILQSLWFRTTLPLPNLKMLDWIYGGCKEITLIRPLLSPSLVHLHARLDDGDHSSVMGLLECYHILCPNLESLQFTYSRRFPHVTTAVSRAISRSQDVKVLLCKSIDEAALMYLASSRELRRLRASLQGHNPDAMKLAAYHGYLDHPPFENLVTLELHLRDISTITPYLRSHSQPLDCISFELDIAPTPEALCEFFTALRSTTRQRTLRQIRISMDDVEEDLPLPAIDFRVLSPLTGFNLRVFNMYLLNPVTLTDSELAQLVQAWPRLEALLLNKRRWDHHLTSNIPTLKGLLSVIERCPKLRSLGLCVDARHVPSLSEFESSICNRAITKLWVADSPIQESTVEIVARFLLDHFPVLTTIRYADYAMWKSVVKLIRQSR